MDPVTRGNNTLNKSTGCPSIARFILKIHQPFNMKHWINTAHHSTMPGESLHDVLSRYKKKKKKKTDF